MLRGKVIIITGASSGIGLASVRLWASHGNKLVLAARSLDKLEAVIQHNESPIETWEPNEYELNKTYAFDTVAFSDWLTHLRKEIYRDTIEKIESGK